MTLRANQRTLVFCENVYTTKVIASDEQVTAFGVPGAIIQLTAYSTTLKSTYL